MGKQEIVSHLSLTKVVKESRDDLKNFCKHLLKRGTGMAKLQQFFVSCNRSYFLNPPFASRETLEPGIQM